jgi:hypothetical protein
MEVRMRTLILATASAIALGLAGAGPIYAQSNTMTPGTMTPGATSPGATTTTQPAAPAATSGATQSSMPQAGAASQPAAPSMSNGSQANQPYMAGTTPSRPASWHATRNDVRHVQAKLRSEGLYRGRIDGLMGPETHQALRGYQQRNGLQTTARLDRDTLNSLLGAGGGQGSSMPGSSAPSSAAGTNGNGNWNSSNPSNTAK